MLGPVAARYTIAALAVALAAAGAGLLYQRALLAEERAAHEKTRAAHSEEKRVQADAARAEEASERELELLRRKARDRNVDEINKDLAATDRVAADLRDAAARLRDRVRTLAAAPAARPAGGDPAAPAGGAAGAAPGMVCSGLYDGASREAEELATAFDRARRRGLGCERSYDTLTPTP